MSSASPLWECVMPMLALHWLAFGLAFARALGRIADKRLIAR